MSLINSFSLAFQQGKFYRTEREFAQGGNPFSVIYQIQQVESAKNVACVVIDHLAPSSALQTALKIIKWLPAFSYIYCPMTTIIKTDYYPQFSSIFNRCVPTICQLPRTCHPFVKRLCEISHKHLGSLTLLATTVSFCALMALGHIALGTSLLLGGTFHFLDTLGYVPHKVSRFVTSYLGFAVSCYFFFQAPGLFTTFNFLAESHSHLSHNSSAYLNFAASAKQNLVSRFLPTQKDSCGLDDAFKPVIERLHLNRNQIDDLLRRPIDDFTLNTAALAKPAFDLETLPIDLDLKFLDQEFDKIDWRAYESLIEAKFKLDDRFIDHLKSKFKSHTHQMIRDNFKGIVKEWKEQEKTSCAQYFISEYKHLMGVLQKKMGFSLQGKRYDLDKALDDLSKIIPFIKGYTKKSQNLDLQDFFLKLGIEAGTYCALGIKRATSEILQGLLQTDSEQTEKSAHYVITLKARLQQLRQNISDTMTQKFIGSHRILEDIHLQKNLKLYFRGFLPLSLPAAKSVNIIEALTTNFHLYQNLRKECMIEYKSRLLAEVKDFGMQNATSYIYSLIQSNPQLSDEEKEDILDYFTTQPKDMNPIEDRFLYLMLYQIGILNLTEE